MYQVHRDLLNSDEGILKIHQNKIAEIGWGKLLLEEQGEDGLWAGKLYSPKWISTHYTLLLMMRLGFPSDHPVPKKALLKYLDKMFYSDGGINVAVTGKESDVCVTGMVLSMLCYFSVQDERMFKMLEFISNTRLKDGGWNCNYLSGDHHSSVHTTLSVIESVDHAIRAGVPTNHDLEDFVQTGREFLLSHKLYKSHRTGEPMQKGFMMLSFPPRWFYDILKSLDYFQEFDAPYNDRMEDALGLLTSKQKKNGTWPGQNKHAGRVYFDMEKPGSDSRWNTLRALRVLRQFEGRT